MGFTRLNLRTFLIGFLFAVLFLFFWKWCDLIIVTSLSLVYSIYLVYLLIDSLGKRLPIFELTMALFGIQLIVSPILDYHVLDGVFLSTMKVSEEHYFEYMLPAIIGIHFGFLMFFRKHKYLFQIEGKLMQKIYNNRIKVIRQGYLLIIIGLICELLRHLPIPSSFAFIIFLLGMFKEIGVFYLWISKGKYFLFCFCLVFGFVAYTAIKSTIFIDLMVWSIIIMSYYLRQVKINKIILTIVGLIAFSVLFILQSVKYSYREIAWDENTEKEKGASVLLKMMYDQARTMDLEKFKLAGEAVNLRFNQGWIVSDVIHNIDKHGTNKGAWFTKEFIGVLLPRFLYPNKPKVGDHDKFEEFTGWSLTNGVSMNVGVVGDGYGNFGRFGGIVFCTIYGMFLGFCVNMIYKVSFSRYALLYLWIPIIFFYIMRAGNDFYIIANWIVKSSVLIALYFSIIENSPVRRSIIKIIKS